MSYLECLELTTEKIIKNTDDILTAWVGDVLFDEWVENDCARWFGSMFLNTFRSCFGEYINESHHDIIWTYGKQMVHLLKSLKGSRKIIQTAKLFVSDQVRDFGEWCPEVGVKILDI